MPSNVQAVLITCPKCSEQFPLTESLAAPLVAEKEKLFESRLESVRAEAAEDALRTAHLAVQAELAKKDTEIDFIRQTLEVRDQEVLQAQQKELEVLKRENEIAAKESALEIERQRLEKDLRAGFEQQLIEERKKAAEQASLKAKNEVQSQLSSKDQEIAELEEARQKSSKEAAAAQAALRTKERELKIEKEKMEVAIQTAVNEQIEGIQTQAVKDSEAKHKLRLAQKDRDIADMKRQIEELQKKAEESSQQRQGEIQELELEKLLSMYFPGDAIFPVAKGIAGADVLQRVLNKSGQTCGAILWESKRTKSWSDSWLPKLRNEQRQSGANAAIIVTEALPKSIDGFGLVNEVWVTEFRYLVPVATAVRHGILEVALVKTSEEGQQTKKELVYKYLTGQQFKQRMQAIVEVFGEMQEELEKERRSTARQFANREGQIRRIVDATAGMYGDFQGIAGRTLSEVEGLALPSTTGRSRALK